MKETNEIDELFATTNNDNAVDEKDYPILSDFSKDYASEDAYHEDNILSYSILSQYERNGGFKWLPENKEDLWKPTVKTDALLFGGAVDAIITSGMDKFNSEYRVLDIPQVPDKIKQVIDRMIEEQVQWSDTERIVAIMNELQFYPTWRQETRCNKLNEGLNYYNALCCDDKRLVITREMYDNILKTCDSLHASPLVSALMFDKLPKHQDRFFQLKFTTKIGNIPYKIMCDMIIVDHKKKEIKVYDLKTSGKESYNFRLSYLDFGYHIQSWLYRIVLEDVLCMTDFSDYKIEGFYFIVASKVSGEPCVWQDMTEVEGAKYRDPLRIGQEIADAYNEAGHKKTMPDWCDASKVNILNFR